MGKRSEWTDEEIREYVDASYGHLATAAKSMSNDWPDKCKVTRQNLQTWINFDLDFDDNVNKSIDQSELMRVNRNLTNTNNRLRREAREILDATLVKQDVLQGIGQAVAAAEPSWPKPYIPMEKTGKPITVELLFSDLQLGKLMDGYDSKVAERRVEEWIEVAMHRILNYQLQGYTVEKIIFAVLGDIIESDKKHANSGRGCDIGTAEQMSRSIDILFHRIIKRLALLGVPLDVIMITGNHDHDGHGLSMFMPGREHLSWPMYQSIRMLSEQAGIDATFYIPEGSFHVHSIYGANVLYEHGVGVATSETAMRKHVANRINQGKEYIHLFRMGDKHNICRFNNDRFTVNGAFFGDDRIGSDYSGIIGYDGEPAQIMFAYVERDDDRRTPIFDSLVIQLGHIK